MPAPAIVPARVQPLAVAARIVMLALVAAMTLIATRDAAQLGWIALLAVAALPAVIAPDHRILAPLGRFAEVAVTGLAAGSVAAAADRSDTLSAGFGAEVVLPYLAVPLLTAALRRRPTEGAALLGGRPRRRRRAGRCDRRRWAARRRGPGGVRRASGRGPARRR